MQREPRISVSIPLDSDSFLRRGCPTCEREFKWLPSSSGGAEQPDPAGYFCPYCGVQAPIDNWFTHAQVDYLQAVSSRRIVGPMFDAFERSGFKVERNLPSEPSDFTEADDMRRVDFICHPAEPLKVLDDWSGPVLCLICGTPSTT
jgi:hypothetical protein